MENFIQSIANWPFLQEPLYRWFLFLGALLALNVGWATILGFMK